MTYEEAKEIDEFYRYLDGILESSDIMTKIIIRGFYYDINVIKPCEFLSYFNQTLFGLLYRSRGNCEVAIQLVTQIIEYLEQNDLH